MKSFWWKASVLLLAASGYCMAQSDAPSLGDIARQNRGQKKATVVLSDQDQAFSRNSRNAQSSSSAVSSVKSSDSAAASGPASKENADKSAPKSKDPAAPATAKDKLDFYKSEQEAWKKIAKRDEESLANEKVPFRRQMYQDALDGDRKSIAVVEDKISELQTQVDKKAKTATTAGGK